MLSPHTTLIAIIDIDAPLISTKLSINLDLFPQLAQIFCYDASC